MDRKVGAGAARGGVGGHGLREVQLAARAGGDERLGAGGSGLSEAFPEYSAATAAERGDEAASTGAEALVTACSRCELNFTEAVAADTASGGPGADLQVHDVLELVALSAGVTKEAS